MTRKLEHIRGNAGYGYVKSGELSGDLCNVCGREVPFVSYNYNESAYR